MAQWRKAGVMKPANGESLEMAAAWHLAAKWHGVWRWRRRESYRNESRRLMWRGVWQ
jgi:hypothetical protein